MKPETGEASLDVPAELEVGALVDRRYELVASIGRGGMAEIFEVRDRSGGRSLALKRLKLATDGTDGQHQRARELFEREYHILSQLQHPRIVAVQEYAVDEEGPYYTMELLGGGDLSAMVPLPWQQVCALFRDVCSAAALIHSRRLVHRDLSTRNIRCVEADQAKLIDFGASVPMGVARMIVGSPPFVAPEAADGQALDGRTDLYSIGAGLYHALTGKHAYPARSFARLRDTWSTEPSPPSAFTPGLPEALDELVMELLRLDPALRPKTAAEVSERLAAIAGIAVEEQLQVAQSYLATPSLVGRSEGMARVRRACRGALRRHGSTLLVSGGAGVGRSRFAEACAIEAKLRGATALHAGASDALDGDYGVVRTLAAQLLNSQPEVASAALAPYRTALQQVLPGSDSVEAAGPRPTRQQLQESFCSWLKSVAEERALVVIVDSFAQIDEPSAALMALLATQVGQASCLLIATISDEATQQPSSAVRLLSEEAGNLELRNLTSEDTHALLESIFGDVPHVSGMAARLYSLSDGNPRDVMNLAQHLVDQGIVAHRGGSWALPADASVVNLPDSVSATLVSRLTRLSKGALELAQTIVLSDLPSLRYEECVTLATLPDDSAAMACIDELVAADVLRCSKEYYTLAPAWRQALLDLIPPDGTGRLHRRLIVLFTGREQPFPVVQQQLRSGCVQEAIAGLVEFSRSSQATTDGNAREFAELIKTLSSDWYTTFDEIIAHAQELKRPAKEIHELRSRCCGLMAVTGAKDMKHVSSLLDQLSHDVGLDIYEELADLPADERLKEMFERAMARYKATPPEGQVFDPLSALRPLARATIQAVGTLAATLDYRFSCSLPSLEPLLPLSPAMGVVTGLQTGARYRIGGRGETAMLVYSELLNRLAEADRGGLDESHHRWVVYGVNAAVGMGEAAMGLSSCLKRADLVMEEGSHMSNAMLIRMLNCYFQGEPEKGDQIKRSIEIFRLQTEDQQWFGGLHALQEAYVHGLLADSFRLGRVCRELGECLDRPAWIPVKRFAEGAYSLSMGSVEDAEKNADSGLELTRPGEAQMWAALVGLKLQCLLRRGELTEAIELGQRQRALAVASELGHERHYIAMPLAAALSLAGDRVQGAEVADEVIRALTELGTTGCLLGIAHETRAWVAVGAKDEGAFEHHASLAASHLAITTSRAGRARYERLIRAGRKPSQRPVGAMSIEEVHTSIVKTLATVVGARARDEKRLEILCEHTGAGGGYLFGVGQAGPMLMAQSPNRADERVHAWAEVLLQEEWECDMQTQTDSEDANRESADLSADYQAITLGHWESETFYVSGLALLEKESGVPLRAQPELVAALSREAVNEGSPVMSKEDP